MPNTDYKICHCGRKIYRLSNSTIFPRECSICSQKKKKDKQELLKRAFDNGTGAKKSKATKGKAKKTSKTNKSSIDRRLDAAWSKAVKIQAGNKCEVCGKRTNLNSHHIFSRAKKSVRWDLLNGICLCVGHHIGTQFSAHKTPLTFHSWLTELKGKEFVDKLTLKANSTGKLSQFEKEMMLHELNNYIKTNSK